MKFSPILPGATIGVLGSGQLGRMFAIAARQMGYRVHTLSPDDDTPTGQVADKEYKAAYDDLDAIREFARGVQVVTFEFENVPAATAGAAGEYAPVRPSGTVLHITQNRLREKQFLASMGAPLPPFAHVRSLSELTEAVERIGVPAVLKSAGWGYDGKGQAKILSKSPEDLEKAWYLVGNQEAVLEGFVEFAYEASVVAARGADGSFVNYGLIANSHRNHILDVSTAPANGDFKLSLEAVEITRTILEMLQVVGVLCVEFFVLPNGRLLVNELAPRPHNSGHLTIDACVTSQFEQQLRAICGLPLGSTEFLRPAAMANLLGDLWLPNDPDWSQVAAFPEVKLHLYGKAEGRPGRKMGHLTAVGATAEEAAARVRAARDAITPKRAEG